MGAVLCIDGAVIKGRNLERENLTEKVSSLRSRLADAENRYAIMPRGIWKDDPDIAGWNRPFDDVAYANSAAHCRIGEMKNALKIYEGLLNGLQGYVAS